MVFFNVEKNYSWLLTGTTWKCDTCTSCVMTTIWCVNATYCCLWRHVPKQYFIPFVPRLFKCFFIYFMFQFILLQPPSICIPQTKKHDKLHISCWIQDASGLQPPTRWPVPVLGSFGRKSKKNNLISVLLRITLWKMSYFGKIGLSYKTMRLFLDTNLFQSRDTKEY